MLLDISPAGPAACIICQYHSLVDYTLAQLRPKRKLLYRNKIRDCAPVRSINNLSSSCLPFQSIVFFRFPCWPYRRHRHVILRRHVTFHPYRTTHGCVWPWRRFSRRQLRRRKTTSGFVFGNVILFRRSKSVGKRNFVHGWKLITSDLEKWTCTILELFFRFWFRPYHRHTQVFYFTPEYEISSKSGNL